MRTNAIKNSLSIWAILIAIISLIVVLIITCVKFPNTEFLGFDYQGVIVAILGILIAFLVGWNIYNFIDFKSKLEKLDIDQDTLGEYQIKAADAIMQTDAQMLRFIAIIWSSNLLIHTPSKKLCLMIGASISSIDLFVAHGDHKAANELLNNLMEWIDKAKSIQLKNSDREKLQKQFNSASNIIELQRIDELHSYLFNE